MLSIRRLSVADRGAYIGLRFELSKASSDGLFYSVRSAR